MLKKIVSSIVVITVVFNLVLGGSNVLLSTTESSNTRVAAGGNGSSWDSYSPQNVEINAGESVTWYNPSPVAEPHTVAFITNQSWLPPLLAPFSVPNNARVTSVIPNPNIEPTILPNDPASEDNNKVIVMDNSRASSPVAVDSTGMNLTYLQPNSNYTKSGTEVYINSGYLFPKGQLPPGFPPNEEFTVTFEDPGTFGYMCVLHPWMTGEVVVS